MRDVPTHMRACTYYRGGRLPRVAAKILLYLIIAMVIIVILAFFVTQLTTNSG
jgi:predicted PurR-regulated permease PerM